MDKTFNENEHPRDNYGRFAKANSLVSGADDVKMSPVNALGETTVKQLTNNSGSATLPNVQGNSKYGSQYAKFGDDKKYPNFNTFDVDTGAPIEKKTGYFFTFYQTEAQQGKPISYTADEFDRLIDETRSITGNLYAGKYQGQVEPSFHTENLALAMEYLNKYRQISIYNVTNGEELYNDDYDPKKEGWIK
jgi:hypothetical protein